MGQIYKFGPQLNNIPDSKQKISSRQVDNPHLRSLFPLSLLAPDDYHRRAVIIDYRLYCIYYSDIIYFFIQVGYELKISNKDVESEFSFKGPQSQILHAKARSSARLLTSRRNAIISPRSRVQCRYSPLL